MITFALISLLISDPNISKLTLQADTWPLVEQASRNNCKTEAILEAIEINKETLQKEHKILFGYLQLALAFCYEYEGYNRKSQLWARKARLSFGNRRPSHLPPGFSSILNRTASSSEIKRKIAKQLGLNNSIDRWWLNIPPQHDQRLPGESFIVSDPLWVISKGTKKAAYVTASYTQDLSIEIDSDLIKAMGFGYRLLTHLKPVERHAKLEVDDLKLLTMPIPLIKHWVDKNTDLKDSLNKGQEPFVVTRSWIGDVSVLFSKGNLSKQKWGRLKTKISKLVKHRSGVISFNVSDKNSFRISFNYPQVLLFESMLASYIQDKLGHEEADAKLSYADESMILAQPNASKIVPKDKNWHLVTISSGYYKESATLNQPWNKDSAELVIDALLPFQPAEVHSLYASQERPITRRVLSQFLSRLRFETQKSELLVFYVVSHGFTIKDSDLYLALADIKPETLLKTQTRANSSSIAIDVGNLGELEKIVKSISKRSAPKSKEYISLKELSKILESMGRPFVLMVDSCVTSAQIESFRKELGFVDGLNYLGPHEFVTDEVTKVAKIMNDFAEGKKHLKTYNPIILGAKPGVAAPALPHPTLAAGPYVGPLAKKLFRVSMVQRVNFQPELLSLLRKTVDFQNGVGMITLEGTASWAKWKNFIQRFQPISKKSGVQALLKQDKLYSFSSVGPSKDLVLTWLGEDGWIAGYWSPGWKQPKIIRKGLHFPVIKADLEYIYLWDDIEKVWYIYTHNNGKVNQKYKKISTGWKPHKASADWGQLTVMSADGDVSNADALYELREIDMSFKSVGIVAGEDVLDLSKWGPKMKFIAIFENMEKIYQIDGKTMTPVATCNTPLKHLTVGLAELYGLSADGKVVCRFDFDWNHQSKNIIGLFPEAVDFENIKGFSYTPAGGLLVGIDDTIWSISNETFEWIED